MESFLIPGMNALQQVRDLQGRSPSYVKDSTMPGKIRLPS
jgi:hypothetical protein